MNTFIRLFLRFLALLSYALLCYAIFWYYFFLIRLVLVCLAYEYAWVAFLAIAWQGFLSYREVMREFVLE